MKYLTTLIAILLLCLMSSFSYAEDGGNSYDALQQNTSHKQKEKITNNDKDDIIPSSKLQFRKERHVLVVKSGETFVGMLTNLGMNTKAATKAYNTLKKVYDARNLRVGHLLELTATFDTQTHLLIKLNRLIITPELGVKYILSNSQDGKYEVTVEKEKFRQDVNVITGIIKGSAFNSLINAGVNRRIAGEVINQMSQMVDFKANIRDGNIFDIKYEVIKTADGKIVKADNLLSASFKTPERTYRIYSFDYNYYNEKGETKKTSLNIKPLPIHNAKVSSQFSECGGINYDAPDGTAVFASGSGVVEIAQTDNHYGNYIKIRHNSEYETLYGSLREFSKGINKGVRVHKGQIIGYVGSTKKSTEPHLHFEILYKGQRINPLKARVVTSNNLYGKKLTEYKNRMKEIDALKKGNKGSLGYTEINVIKDENAEILDGLYKRLPRRILQEIDGIEIEFNDKDKYVAKIYIKRGYEQSYKIIGYHAVQEMLNILMEKGYRPFDEKIWVSAFICQRVKGVTGQNMVSPFGNAIYNYTNDSIEWKPWSNSTFGLM